MGLQGRARVGNGRLEAVSTVWCGAKRGPDFCGRWNKIPLLRCEAEAEMKVWESGVLQFEGLLGFATCIKGG